MDGRFSFLARDHVGDVGVDGGELRFTDHENLRSDLFLKGDRERLALYGVGEEDGRSVRFRECDLRRVTMASTRSVTMLSGTYTDEYVDV